MRRRGGARPRWRPRRRRSNPRTRRRGSADRSRARLVQRSMLTTVTLPTKSPSIGAAGHRHLLRWRHGVSIRPSPSASSAPQPTSPTTVVAAFARLIPQLSSSSPAPTLDELVEMATSDADHVLVADDADGAILGSMTLVVFRIPTGVRSWIEDVVVDESARGPRSGRGAQPRRARPRLPAWAPRRSTSRRVPAVRPPTGSTRSSGFELRTTNVYRHNPAAESPAAD